MWVMSGPTTPATSSWRRITSRSASRSSGSAGLPTISARESSTATATRTTDRDRRAGDEHEDRREQRPEEPLAPVAEGVLLVGGPGAERERDEEEELVDRVRGRVDRLGEQRGGAAQEAGDELRGGDHGVRRERDEHGRAAPGHEPESWASGGEPEELRHREAARRARTVVENDEQGEQGPAPGEPDATIEREA
jgi:hypothetical protein